MTSPVRTRRGEETIKGTLFESAEVACQAFKRAVDDIPNKSAWAEGWFHRMVFCIAAEGGFFEKCDC